MSESLQVGAIVSARVERVEIYGIYCQSGDHEVLVLVPEVRWFPPTQDCRQIIVEGAEVKVKILRETSNHTYLGSLKRVDEHANPFTNGTHAAGTCHWGLVEARVPSSVSKVAVGFAVVLDSGIGGFLPNPSGGLNFPIGTRILVEVATVNAAREEIELLIVTEQRQRVNANENGLKPM